MIKLLSALAFALMLLQAPMAAAQSADLTGDWHGVYYEGNQQTTVFELDLVQRGGSLSGTTIEPNGFGSADARFLLATIRGSVSGAQVAFEKTYDGTGGESHTVSYVGQLMPNGRRVVGTWTTGGLQGRFEMVR